MESMGYINTHKIIIIREEQFRETRRITLWYKMIPLEKTLPPSHLKQSLEPQRQRGTDGVPQYFSCECGGVVDHWSGEKKIGSNRCLSESEATAVLCSMVVKFVGVGVLPRSALGFGVFQSNTASPRKPWFSPPKHLVWLKAS
jgi:hypothetical protein